MSNIFDVGIIGAGIAGTFACYKLAKSHKNTKVISFDIGRPPMKRRQQIVGYLGCLPNSDGKLYLNDLDKVSEIVGARKIKSAHSQFNKIIENIGDFKIIKDKSPSISAEKRIKKQNYQIILNDYIQIYPKEIHALSKYMSEFIEDKNITYKFDTEVHHIHKQKNIFIVTADNQEYKCKKLIIAVGRSGWRWAKNMYSNFGIIDNNDTARFGIRVELNSAYLKDFNKSNCTLLNNDIEIGPFSWNGTVIPEDHVDMAISAFRSNENRWKTDKVSFSMIGNRPFPNAGFEQTDRLAKLTFILANDRIVKERVSYILNKKSKISIIPEYNWLINSISDLANVIPEVASKAYYHVPTIFPSAPKINIGNDFSTEIDGLYVVGESAGIHGILAAATMGLICAESVCK